MPELNLTVPSALHRRLVEMAADQGLSVAEVALDLLSRRVGHTLREETPAYPEPEEDPADLLRRQLLDALNRLDRLEADDLSAAEIQAEIDALRQSLLPPGDDEPLINPTDE